MSSHLAIARALDGRKEPLDLFAGRVLIRLSAFVRSVQKRGFTVACRRLLGEHACPQDVATVIEHVGIRITRDLPERNRDVFCKALQETFLEVCGIEHDLELSDADGSVERFLEERAVLGCLELCLRLYVFNSVWISIQDELMAHCDGEEALLDLMAKVREMSHAAVRDSIRHNSIEREWERMRVSEEAGVRLLSRVRERILPASISGRLERRHSERSSERSAR